jgi:PAS domain S-box-containing protein
MGMATSTTVLIVDDDPSDRELLRRLLGQASQHRYTIHEAGLGEAALALIATTPIDCVLLDYHLPDSDGLEMLAELSPGTGELPPVPVVMFTGLGDETLAVRALQAGAMDYLVKDRLSGPHLHRAVHEAMRHHRLRSELRERQRYLEAYTLELEERVATLQARLDAELGRAALHEALEAERLRFAKVASTVPGAICTYLLSPAGVLSIPYASPAFEKVFGLPPAVVADHTAAMRERLDPETLARLDAAIVESARTLQPWRTEYRYDHPARGQVWLEVYAIPSRGDDGSVVWHGVTLDVTERKQTEEQLRRSELRARALIEHAPGALTLLNAEGKLTFVSASSERVMGYDPDAVLGLDPSAVTHPDDLPALLGVLYELLQRPGDVRKADYRMRHGDGSWRWVESTISNLLDEPSIGAIAFNFQDITERKQAELALRASEERYRGLLASLDSMVATVDAAGVFQYVNEGAARAVFHTPEELIGKTLGYAFPEPHATRYLDVIRKVILDDTQLVVEVQGIVYGQPRWVRITVQPIHDATGRVIHALVNATDIDTLKTTQEELLELNQTLEERVRERTAEVQDLYDRAPTGYYGLDAGGCIVSINQTLLDWLGYTREEVLGRPFTELKPPDQRETFQNGFEIFKTRGWLRGLDGDLLRKDGTTFPALFSATAIYDADGTFVRSRNTVFDNTEHKQAEDALRESEEQNRLLFEESPVAVALFDQHGTMVRINRAMVQLVGHPDAQLVGRTLEANGIVTPEQLASIAAEVAPMLHQLKSISGAIVPLTRLDGEKRVAEIRAFKLNIRGQRHYLAALHDVTAEKQTQESLRLANAELAQAARAKDEFLANMSHELRTPLNAILGYSESLQEQVYGPLSGSQYEALRNIEKGGRHLLTLINDILDLAKVEAGRLDLQLERVSVEELCHTSLLFVREQALKKRLKLEFNLSDERAAADVDPTRLKQMLVNLLSNAVKFTPEDGRVSLDVSVDPDMNAVRFQVRDTGIGIAPEDLARLFQPFNQLDSALNRKYEGTGLGLALVARIAALHGGRVAVQSAPGQGSCFTITLPYRHAPEDAASAADSRTAPTAESHGPFAAGAVGRRVLLGEDNDANSDVVSEYLRTRGYEVFVARDGYAALEQASAIRADLVIMDIQMPGIDGLEAIQRLRELPDYAGTPIVALTARAMPDDEQRCLAAGATAYMTKPVSLRALLDTMQQLLAP